MPGNSIILAETEKDPEIFSPSKGSEILSFWWLGQAGFALLASNTRILIDPYLSDSLAKKYKGKEYPHERMMPVPVRPEDLPSPDWVLVSHRHSDHMDPETLLPLAKNNPAMKIILPAAWYHNGLQMGIDKNQISAVDSGDKLSIAEGISVAAIPSAHEKIETNKDGKQLYLGYILSVEFNSDQILNIYHSGDCIPYPGLADMLQDREIDVAFLPVNGRDSSRMERGVPGNFTFTEAIELCKQAFIPCMVPHHFGMFEFNTIPIGEMTREMDRISDMPYCTIPQTGMRYAVKSIREKERSFDMSKNK